MSQTAPTESKHVELITRLAAIVGSEAVVHGEEAEKYSKDFYWYSPVLKELLEDKRADMAILISDRDQLGKVVSLLYQAGVPITLRGAATGNYGQAIPLHGGAVLELSGMNRIFRAEEVLHAETGATLGRIETEAQLKGWELRCMPSTWVKSTFGGFLCGGSGGIGSITYGGINYGDNMKSVTLMTVEENPRLLRFEEKECATALHTYGTTGILVEAEMRLGRARPWEQLIFVSKDWESLLAWTHRVASDPDVHKRLVTQFENPIPSFFKPLRKHLPENVHATFLMVDRDEVEIVRTSAMEAGIEMVYQKDFPVPPRPPYIGDFTWNHTTLWAIRNDPGYTYLQCGFGDGFIDKFHLLNERFPDEILLHLEWVLNNDKMDDGDRPPGAQVGGIPLVRFRSAERLQEIIDYCLEIGIRVANPHTCLLEEGGAHPDIEAKRKLKDLVDPKALLNPGKMKSYPKNPFRAEATV